MEWWIERRWWQLKWDLRLASGHNRSLVPCPQHIIHICLTLICGGREIWVCMWGEGGGGGYHCGGVWTD